MPVAMPSPPGFTRSNFGLEAHTLTFASQLTRNTQRVELGGARWVASYTIRRFRRTDARVAQWIAFFLQCGGMANAFLAYDPDRKAPRGFATGTPLVKGAGQLGKSLLIDGAAANTVGWLKAGDYFAVHGEMKQITQDADTDGGGETTLHFAPALRYSPPDNAPLTLANVACTMILVDDRQGMWEADNMGVYEEKTFSGMEVF